MLLYVTNVYPRNHLTLRAQKLNISYLEMSPWVPSKRIRKFLLKVWPHLGEILKSRQLLSDESSAHHINLTALSSYSPFCRHILKRQPNPSVEKAIRRIETRRINKFISNSNVSVVTSDFLNPNLRFTSEINLLEFRWHHTLLNSNRIPAQLCFPAYFDPLEFNDEIFNQTLAAIDESVDFYIFYSNLAAKSFIDYGGLAASKTLVAPLIESFEYVHHGDLANFRDRDFLYVGRGEYDKGVDIAISVAKELGRRITVIGSFSPQITNWMKSFNFVDVLGNLPRQEVYRIMNLHKILLSTGIESFGFAVLEAISNGMLVVGTDYCGSLGYSVGCNRVFVSESNSMESLNRSALRALDEYGNRVDLECNHSTKQNDWKTLLNFLKLHA